MLVCSCKSHSDDNAAVHRISSKKFKKCVLQVLIEKKVLNEKSTYLCTSCANECLETLSNAPIDKAVDDIIKLIAEKKLSHIHKKRLLQALLQEEKKSIENDCRHLCLKYKDTEYLQSLDHSDWLKDRNHMVVDFLCTISGNKIKDLSEKQKAAISFALEQNYSLISSKIIMPFTFSKNLLSYYFSGSKAICTMNSVAGPGGSYQSVLSWIAQQGADTVCISKIEDLITFLDNNQILTRRWRVKYDQKNCLVSNNNHCSFISI